MPVAVSVPAMALAATDRRCCCLATLGVHGAAGASTCCCLQRDCKGLVDRACIRSWLRLLLARGLTSCLAGPRLLLFRPGRGLACAPTACAGPRRANIQCGGDVGRMGLLEASHWQFVGTSGWGRARRADGEMQCHTKINMCVESRSLNYAAQSGGGRGLRPDRQWQPVSACLWAFSSCQFLIVLLRWPCCYLGRYGRANPPPCA